MSKNKRKVIQFFVQGDTSLALCDTGEVFEFRVEFKEGRQIVVWRHRPEFENPEVTPKE